MALRFVLKMIEQQFSFDTRVDSITTHRLSFNESLACNIGIFQLALQRNDCSMGIAIRLDGGWYGGIFR